MDNTTVDTGNQEFGENNKNKINPKVAAIVAGGALSGVVLAGGAAYAVTPPNTTNTIETDTKGEGKGFLGGVLGGLEGDDHAGGGGNNEAKGTPFNIHTAPHAHNVDDTMSFDEAFASARKEVGAGGIFEWKGQVYGTFLANEVDKSGNPVVEYEKVPTHQYQPPVNANNGLYTDSQALNDDFDIIESPDEVKGEYASTNNNQMGESWDTAANDSVERGIQDYTPHNDMEEFTAHQDFGNHHDDNNSHYEDFQPMGTEPASDFQDLG